MPLTTHLPDHLRDRKTTSDEVNRALHDARLSTGEDWQVTETIKTYRWWFTKRQAHYFTLHKGLGLGSEYQEMMCVNTENECLCYLYGILSGVASKNTEGKS